VAIAKQRSSEIVQFHQPPGDTCGRHGPDPTLIANVERDVGPMILSKFDQQVVRSHPDSSPRSDRSGAPRTRVRSVEPLDSWEAASGQKFLRRVRRDRFPIRYRRQPNGKVVHQTGV